MGDSKENVHQGDETDIHQDDETDASDPVSEGQTTEEGEVESQDAGEDTASTDQDVEVEEDDRSGDLTSSEVEDKEEDPSNCFFNPHNSLQRTDFSSGSLKDSDSSQNTLPQDRHGRNPTQAARNIGPPKTDSGESNVVVRRSFSDRLDLGEGSFLHPEQAKETMVTPRRDFDLSTFNGQSFKDDLERTVEDLRAQHRQFSVVGQANQSIGQLMSQMTEHVGEASTRMLEEKMNGINERLNKLGEKYEKIKELEEQMKEGDQILELLLHRR